MANEAQHIAIHGRIQQETPSTGQTVAVSGRITDAGGAVNPDDLPHVGHGRHRRVILKDK